jgi:hypothetical protein
MSQQGTLKTLQLCASYSLRRQENLVLVVIMNLSPTPAFSYIISAMHAVRTRRAANFGGLCTFSLCCGSVVGHSLSTPCARGRHLANEQVSATAIIKARNHEYDRTASSSARPEEAANRPATRSERSAPGKVRNSDKWTSGHSDSTDFIRSV